MSKKLVWLGIVLIVSMLLFISVSVIPVEAYQLHQWDKNTLGENTNIRITSLSNTGVWVGGVYLTNCTVPSYKILSTSVDRITDLETDADVNGCGQTASPPYQIGVPIDPSVIKSFINTPTNMCLKASRYSLTADVNSHMVLGGYVYVTNPVTNVGLKSYVSQGLCKRNDNLDLYTYLAIYNVNDSGIAGIDRGSTVDLQTDKEWDYIFGPQTQDNWCGYYGNTGEKPALAPGLYYVVWAGTLFGDHDNGCSDTYGSEIFLALNNENYTVSSYYLTIPELKQRFSADVIDNAFCIPAGGLKSNITGLPHYGCCRDGYYGNVSMEYMCVEGSGWISSTEKNYCESLNPNNSFESKVLDTYVGSSPRLEYIDKTKDGTDGCCGDDEGLDGGFISKTTSTPSRTQYLCYNHTVNDIKNYTWFDAMLVKYKIKTVETSEGQVDVVSNSQDWFYCNANDKNQLNGKPIAEGKTFTSQSEDGRYSCAAMADMYYSLKYDVLIEFLDWPGDSFPPIGPEGSGFCKGKESLRSVDSCECYIVRNNKWAQFKLSTFDAPASNPAGMGDSSETDILKDLCLFDASSCLSTSFSFEPTLDCKANARANNFNIAGTCNSDTHVCLGGISVNTSDSNYTTNTLCCFGSNATCVNRTEVNTSTTTACALSGGKVFEKTGTDYTCKGSSLPISGNTYCCFGTLSIPIGKYFTQSMSPTSFKCFKKEGDNILSQCCYDSSCKNIDYVPNVWGLDTYNNRVTSLGSVQNTVANFDSFNPDGSGLILDFVRKYKFPADGITDGGPVFSNLFIINKSLVDYSYLEFDTAYSTDMLFKLNGVSMGKLSDYSTNGNKIDRWHHIVIDTKDFVSKNPTASTILESLRFYSVYSMDLDANIIIDNVVLTPSGNDLQHTSNNSYCTGGFEGWIDDLDPTPTGSDFFKKWDNYGPYMMTCDGIGPYTWTGQYCCGDDTKLNNYGEYYNDTSFGCFGGSQLLNDWTVSYAKNQEWNNSYINKDLLYYNNTFMGCQVPSGKYNSLDVSYDGTKKYGDLVSSNINAQCAVVGHHYCMDNTWKQDFDIGAAKPLELTNQVVKLKTSPAGPNLIRNGFRPTN